MNSIDRIPARLLHEASAAAQNEIRASGNRDEAISSAVSVLGDDLSTRGLTTADLRPIAEQIVETL